MQTMSKRYVMAGLAIFALFYCAGCGLIGDAATHVQALQLPPGELCSPNFYQTATPEEVKKKIGGRSLADAHYTYKEVDRERPISFVGGIAEGLTFPFVSYNYVRRSTVTPLMVAAFSTPHPEVMMLLLDAGAGQYVERDEPGYIRAAVRIFLRRHSDKKSFSLLLPFWEQDPCKRFISFFGGVGGTTIAAFDDYLAFFPNTDLNCRSYGEKTPLEAAMSTYEKEQVRWLLSKGAAPGYTFSTGKTALARAASRQENMVGCLLEYGAQVAPLTQEERDALLKALVRELRGAVSRLEEEKLEKLLDKTIRTGNQRALQEVGALCSLPLAEKSARLAKMLE